jgi:predicted nucleotidyltransferase
VTREEFFERIAAHRTEWIRAGVRRLGVYGLVARNEASTDGHVEVLVEFEQLPDLYDFAMLRDRLSEILGRHVSLATPDAFKPRLRSRVLNEVCYGT